MTTTRSSRIFASGDATTLYVTIPADVVADSQFPFAADETVTVSIDGDSLVVTGAEG
jgi:hypothetical protein